MHIWKTAVLLGLGMAACSQVEVFDRFEPLGGVIEGTVVVQLPPVEPSPCQESRTGDVILSLFAVDDPPPPEGTGEPLTFVLVPEAQVFGAGTADARGVPFVFPSVATGRYTIQGFVDTDGDFNPNFGVTGQPTAFDVAGGAVDPTTRAFVPIEVVAGEATRNVVVSLGQVVPFERPVFTPTSSSARAGTRLDLVWTPLDRGAVQADPACGGFAVSLRNPDPGGVPADRDGDGLPDLFPRVLFTRPSESGGTVVVPGIVDPLPFLDTLSMAPTLLTDVVSVWVSPLAFQISAPGSPLLPIGPVPAGAYDATLLSGSGQTWSVPNALDLVDPPSAVEGPTAGQNSPIDLRPAPAAGAGQITGVLEAFTEPPGSTYVFAYAVDDPPPPVGAGRPVAVTQVQGFANEAAGLQSASYVLTGLSDGDYLVQALRDVDRNFSGLVDLLAVASASDRVGSLSSPVAVRAGVGMAPRFALNETVQYDRPAFQLPATEVSRLPARIRLKSRSVLGSEAGFPVQLAGGDLDGDNLPDLFPRVLLQPLTETADPRTASVQPGAPTWLGWVDPVPYLVPLSRGEDAVVVQELEILLLPVALDSAGRRVLPPPGRYRVTLVSRRGQTWSVPNDLDLRTARVGTPREDPQQATVVEWAPGPVPPGRMEVRVELASVPTGPFTAVVFAYPAGGPLARLGAPSAQAVLGPADFSGGVAEATLTGLATGDYVITGFVDRTEDFVPWLATRAQPDAGDAVGGAFEASGRLRTISVDALGPAASATVQIGVPVANDPPAFQFAPGSTGPTLQLDSLTHNSSLLSVRGRFTVQWVDEDRDGQADDLNGDSVPDVYPLVVAESVQGAGAPVFGFVDPSQFSGFPSSDPSQTGVQITAERMTVQFPPSIQGPRRVVVVQANGQRWFVPNEWAQATGTDLPQTQGRPYEASP